MQGLTTSDTVYGCDDYTPIDSTISEIMVVIGNISRILDKHAAPSMQGPDAALEATETGEYVFPAGNFLSRNSRDDPEYSYLTWDGQLSAAFAHLKTLLEQLYVTSEMGEALLGTNTHQGVTTYKALKLRMTSALSKVRRIAANITEPVKQAVCAALALEDFSLVLRPEELSVWWNDGIPGDPAEEMELIQLENGGKPTMSHLRSVMIANKMTREQAEEELNLIQEDMAADMPVTLSAIDSSAGLDGEPEGGD